MVDRCGNLAAKAEFPGSRVNRLTMAGARLIISGAYKCRMQIGITRLIDDACFGADASSRRVAARRPSCCATARVPHSRRSSPLLSSPRHSVFPYPLASRIPLPTSSPTSFRLPPFSQENFEVFFFKLRTPGLDLIFRTCSAIFNQPITHPILLHPL